MNTRARPLWAHLKNEARLLSRESAALIFGVVIPVVAMLVMAALPAARTPTPALGGRSVVAAYTPVLVLFAGSVLGLTVIPAILGNYRQWGVLRRLATTPSTPGALLAALFLLVLLIAFAVELLLVAIPALAGASWPPAPGWFALGAGLSTVMFVALGAWLAALVPSAKAAAGIGNVLAVLVWGAAGMWFPRSQFAPWLRLATELTPGGAAAETMQLTGLPQASAARPLFILLAWTAIACWAATRSFKVE